MTWGPMFMYYHCPKCGLKFEYAVMGVYEKDGARQPDDADYLEVE